MLFIRSKISVARQTKSHSSLTCTSGAFPVIYGNHKCTQNFWEIVLRVQRFLHWNNPPWSTSDSTLGSIPWLWQVLHLYRGLIFGLAHEFSHNLISHVDGKKRKKMELRTLSFCTWRPSGPVHYHIFQAFVVAMALDVQRGRFPQEF